MGPFFWGFDPSFGFVPNTSEITEESTWLVVWGLKNIGGGPMGSLCSVG